ncbi:MAG: hypothetical protein ACYS76_00075 [Planctomycetota bacterium]|jgi:hypothetical protein
MPDNNYNIVKPVEGLQNIAGLTPAKRREERRRRRNLKKEGKQESEQDTNGTLEEPSVGGELSEDEGGGHSIDYCA